LTGKSSARGMTRKKIAVLYPVLMGGGAEAVCAWMLQALQDEYEVTLYSLVHEDIRKINTYFGTRIPDAGVKVRSVFPKAATTLAKKFFSRYPCRAYRQKLLREEFIKDHGAYDLAISAYNEMDMGQPGLQYLHNTGVVDGGHVCSGGNKAFKKNRTIANSLHTANNVAERYGVSAKIIFPPVFSGYEPVGWDKKNDSFVCLGRLVSAKMAHRAINILKKVREGGHEVDLHIVGGRGETAYMKLLEKMRRENSGWVFIHRDLERVKLNKLLENSRYGIHIKPEPFGIVPAEMFMAGVVPFVRKSQGLLEVVGDREEVLFSNDAEAADKIDEALSSEENIKKLRRYFEERKSLFSEKKFCEDMKREVKDFFDKKK